MFLLWVPLGYASALQFVVAACMMILPGVSIRLFIGRGTRGSAAPHWHSQCHPRLGYLS